MDDDFLALRRYTRLDAAQLLRVPKTWIKDWVTARVIPMQRSGTCRGVWFTRADILAIGEMLPALMSGRQANAQVRQETRALLAIGQAGPDVRETPGADNPGMDGEHSVGTDQHDPPPSSATGQPMSAGSNAARLLAVSEGHDSAGMLAEAGALDVSKYVGLRSVPKRGSR